MVVVVVAVVVTTVVGLMLQLPMVLMGMAREELRRMIEASERGKRKEEQRFETGVRGSRERKRRKRDKSLSPRETAC